MQQSAYGIQVFQVPVAAFLQALRACGFRWLVSWVEWRRCPGQYVSFNWQEDALTTSGQMLCARYVRAFRDPKFRYDTIVPVITAVEAAVALLCCVDLIDRGLTHTATEDDVAER